MGIWAYTLVGFCIISLLFTQYAFAEKTIQGITVKLGSEDLSVLVIYASQNESCTDDEIAEKNFYTDATSHYLKKFNPSFNEIMESQCMKIEQIDTSTYPLILRDLGINRPDLLIFIGNVKVNDELVIEDHAVGVWACAVWESSYVGCLSSILVICTDCSDLDLFHVGTEKEFGVWTLSHELSHYLLNLKKYSPNIYADGVHNLQTLYDNCILNNQIKNCSKLYEIQYVKDKPFRVMDINYIVNHWREIQNPSLNISSETLLIDKYRDNASEMQLQVNSKLESLLLGFTTAKNSIEGLSFQSSEANQELLKAWDAFKNAEKSLYDAQWTQQEGQDFLSELKYEESYYKYLYSWDKSLKMELALYEISTHIQNAQNLEEVYIEESNKKFCFLFWCW